MRLYINERNVTAHLYQGERAGDHITIALYGIVEGLTHNWWSMFGNRDQATQLRHFRNGYAVPDIRCSFDGSAFQFRAHPITYDNPAMTFASGSDVIMSRREAEHCLTEFIDRTLRRLDDSKCQYTAAHLRWQRVLTTLSDEDEAAFCEAAGSLGLDPYRIADADADFIEAAEALFEEREALVEFTAGARQSDRTQLLSWVKSTLMAPDEKRYRLADVADIARSIRASEPKAEVTDKAWERGYRIARSVRNTLGVKQETTFRSYKDLAARFGSDDFTVVSKIDGGINAIRRELDDGTHIYLRDHGMSPAANTSNMFSLARGIGDAICFPDVMVSPINGVKNAYRQAAGRAFAAEFLAPSDEVESMLEDGKDIDSIADNFGVSTQLVQLQVENRERIAQVITEGDRRA